MTKGERRWLRGKLPVFLTRREITLLAIYGVLGNGRLGIVRLLRRRFLAKGFALVEERKRRWRRETVVLVKRTKARRRAWRRPRLHVIPGGKEA